MSKAWQRFLGIGEEVGGWGNGAAASVWLPYYGRDDLEQKKQVLDLDGTQETRSKIEVAAGDETFDGSIPDIEVVPDVVGLLFKAAMGEVDGNAFEAKDGALPSLAIEKQLGDTQLFRAVGCKVNELVINSRARETLKMTAAIVGKWMKKSVTPTARTYSTKKPFVFYQGVFKLDTVEVKIREFDINILNVLRHPNHQSGDIYTQEQTEGVRDVNGSVLLDFKNVTDFYNKFEGVTEAALQLLFTAGSDTLTIDIPKAVFPELTFDQGDQDVEQRVSFRCLREDADNKEVTLTLVDN